MKNKKFIRCLTAMFVMVMSFTFTGITAKAYGLTQSVQDKNSITVNWDKESDAVEYYVGYGEDSKTARTMAESKKIKVPATQLSYKITGLKPGTEYYAYILYKYVRTYSNNEYTSTASSGYVCTLPGKVTGLNQTKWWYYIKKVDFGWDDQSAAEYEYIVKDNKNKNISKGTSRSNRSSVSKIKNNMVYNVKVRAYVTINNQKYYGDYSDTAYLFTQPMVDSKKSKLSNGKLKITWNKVSGVTGYDIYVSNKEKSGYKKVKSVNSKKSSVTISKFKNKKISKKKKYYVYIVAKKKVGKKTYTSGRHYTFEIKQKKLNWTFN